MDISAESRTAVQNISGLQKVLFMLMRMAVGWHFLYEGYYKLTNPGWSSVGYLHNVPGPLGPLFDSLAGSIVMVQIVDAIMLYGLTIIGMSLILGFMTRWFALTAAVMLLLFYLSNPPWPGVRFMAGEGNYLIVDKNATELFAALLLAAFPAGKFFGVDQLIGRIGS